eukprot:XP_019078874.1 PREDICTED: uncharacterized protein LOC104880916 [Vitis vinifera]
MSISSEGNGYVQKLADYIGLPCRIARGCKYCVANALLHFSRVSLSHGFDAHSYGIVFSCKMVTSHKYDVPLEESQDCSWAPLDKLWCALSTSQVLIYLMLLMSYFF